MPSALQVWIAASVLVFSGDTGEGAMGHGTPDKMNWAGLLQNLLLVVHIWQIIGGSLQFSIPEELEPGTLVGSLNKHFPPPFQLLTKEYLWMDQQTGNLYTTEERMDREAMCPKVTSTEECYILQNAVVGPSRDLIQFAVIIDDINDNSPYFDNSKIHLKVPEDVAVGTSFLLDDQAQDKDGGHNVELQYHLKGSAGVFGLILDGPSVEIVVQTALDRETQDVYQMYLVASDGSLESLSATATLIIIVTDVNDNCPSFSSDNPQSITIAGESPQNMVVTQVRALDQDSAPNAVITYSLSPKVSERVKKLFSIDSLTGHIRLTQDLQSDELEELVLKVQASSHHCPPADTQVTISVLPKANQEPTIKIGFIVEHQNQTMVLPENQPPTILAILELEGDSSSKDSSLAIEGELPFNLSSQNGKYLLSTSKPLDYEIKSEHHISVIMQTRSAEGSMIIASKQVIRVLVGDVNDNAPHFSQSVYQLEVEENNQSGKSLLQLTASDADSGYNGRVTYRLDIHSSTTFTIDSMSGELSVSAPLDREQRDVHILTVSAQDGGYPPMESVATVSVLVLDQNDNVPVFATPHFIFFIPENAPPFAQVGRVDVKDPDEGENGYTELHVLNNQGPFFVDNTQGTLRTTTSMDRESNSRYELYLLASDHGRLITLTSTARVTIFGEDVNDNQPKVILPSSNFSCTTVPLSTLAGTMVFKIYAIDKDSGLNSEMTYSVVTPSQNNSPFQVDIRSGNITLNQQLLHKHLGMHHLFVVVRDGGKPAPLYTTVWINLLINESKEPCHLDRAPSWTGMSDFVQTPLKASICEMETARSAQVTMLIGLGMMLLSMCLLVATVVVYVRQRRLQKRNRRECRAENEIPLRLEDKYYSDN